MEKEQIKPEQSTPAVWDCGSTLYDFFELKSLKRQLDSAMASRSFSMPHYAATATDWPRDPHNKASKRISLSVRKFLRSVFAPKSGRRGGQVFESPDLQPRRPSVDGRLYFLYGRPSSGLLPKIQEVPGTRNGREESPELRSFVRRTASDRFTVASVGVLCS